MKKRIPWLAVSCLMVLSLALVSCGKTTPATTTTTQTQSTTTVPTTVKTTIATTATATTTAPVKTTAAAMPQYGGIMRIGEFRLVTYLGNPAKMSEAFGERDAAPAIETLLRIDSSGQVVPWLAKSWGEDPVAMTITLTLNTGIMFSDGTPFNAAAVKWNLDADVAAKQIGYAVIKSVDVVNDSTVRINMTQWDNTLLDILGYSYIGMIISPTTAQKMGAAWTNTNPVGTGPFIFENWIPQVSLAYSKNLNYWQSGKPYLDRIQNVIIVDQTVSLLNFKKGNTDVLVNPATSDLNDLIKTYPNTTRLPFAANGVVRAGAVFDSADPKSPFADVRVRQAVQYAVNSDEINKTILGGNGQVSNQFVTKDNWGYDPTIVGYPYNPTKAKQLLSDAGIAPGQIKTNYYYQTGDPYDSYAVAFKGYLQAVGIDLVLNPVSLTGLTPYLAKWNGLVALLTVASPDPAEALRDTYTGIDARYFGSMLVPADYKQAVTNACTAADFATKQKYVREADKLFTDKYCLAVTWAINASASAKQAWIHDDGLYSSFAATCLWSPEIAWKDPGH